MDQVLKKNIILNIVLKISDFIFPLITYSYVARILTPIGTGKVAFVNSILTYFYYIAILGIPTYGIRECSKVKNDREKLSNLVQELLVINVVSMLLSYILLLTAVLSNSRLWEYRNLFFVMSISIFLNTIGVEWLYKALEEYSYITKRSLIFKCISIGLIFILIHSKDDYLIYGFLSVFTVSASNICNFVNMHRFVSMGKRNKYRLMRHLRPILILFSASIIITIYANFDVSMIGFIRSEREVGIYNAALKVENALFAFASAISSTMVPRITKYFSDHDIGEVKKILVVIIRIALCCTIPIAIFIFLFSDDVILLIFGKGYTDASRTLKILMLCILPLIVSNLFGAAVLIPLGLEKRYTQSVFIGMIINLALNMLLIPFFGSVGAAIGTFFTELWNACYMSGGVKRLRKIVFREIKLETYLIAYIASGFLCMCFYKYIIQFNLIFIIAILAIIYFLVIYIILLIFHEPLLYPFLKNRVKM